MKWLLMIVALLCLAATSDEDPNDVPCDNLIELRHAGQLDAAADRADRCLDEDPDDVEVMIEYARVLMAQDNGDAATTWTDRALEAAPEHGDAILLRARLLARQDDFAGARDQLDSLDEADRQSLEARRFQADLALWSGDHRQATRLYTSYLDDASDDGQGWTNLGHAQHATDYMSAAKSSYERGCELGYDSACAAIDNVPGAYRTRYYGVVRPGYLAARDRPDSQSLRLALGVQPTASTTLEAGYLLVRRDFRPDPALFDMGLTLDGTWTSDFGPRAGAGAGWMFDADFSAPWNAYVEGGWTYPNNLDVGLRLGRIQFPTTGTNLVVPSATYYRGAWMFDARYFLGLNDTGSINHSGLARAHYYFGNRTSLYAGAGLGNAPDYIDRTVLSEQPAVGHYIGLAGGSLEISDRQFLNLDIQYRHESSADFWGSAAAGPDRYQGLEVMLGYKVFNW